MSSSNIICRNTDHPMQQYRVTTYYTSEGGRNLHSIPIVTQPNLILKTIDPISSHFNDETPNLGIPSHLTTPLRRSDSFLISAMDEVHWSRVRSTRNCTRPPYYAICNLPLSMPITQILPLLLAQPDLLSVGDTTWIGVSSLEICLFITINRFSSYL